MVNLLYKNYHGPSADTRPTYIGNFDAEFVMPVGTTIRYAGRCYKVLSCELATRVDVHPHLELRYYVEEIT